MKHRSISVDQDRNNTSIVAKYLDTATVKTSTKFYKTTFPYDTVFTKSDVSTSDDQVEKLNKGFNIQYRAFIVSIIYFYLQEHILVLQYTS